MIRLHRTLALGLPSALLLLPAAAAQGNGGHDPCQEVALLARRARQAELTGDLFHHIANCFNIDDQVDRHTCIVEGFVEFFEERGLANEQFDARVDLCHLLGPGTYEPEIDPDDFVELIDNPFFPHLPGTTRVYELVTTDGEVETVTIEVTDRTREILGVECTVVVDTEDEDGEVVEITEDYFAQDVHGNVWYFGEISQEFEDGYLTDLGGSWIAGEDFAHPGIVMPAAPIVGETYRQEFLLGEAEDAATVLALDATADVPFGSFTNCLRTFDFTPLEPDAEEEKVYAAGVGTVLEVDLETGERLELISVTTS